MNTFRLFIPSIRRSSYLYLSGGSHAFFCRLDNIVQVSFQAGVIFTICFFVISILACAYSQSPLNHLCELVQLVFCSFPSQMDIAIHKGERGEHEKLTVVIWTMLRTNRTNWEEGTAWLTEALTDVEVDKMTAKTLKSKQ